MKRSAELQLKSRLKGAANQPRYNLPPWLITDLRSDHAGETGAVYIYKGILALARDKTVRDFAERHLVTEEKHLALLSSLLNRRQQTLLLPVWRLMGWLTGALPSLFGASAVYATIQAVETFVDRHYEYQIKRLSPEGPYRDLRQLLLDCQQDECAHRDEAAQLMGKKLGIGLWLWRGLVSGGSKAAVFIAKRI